MVTTGCTGILRLARAFTRASLRMTTGESIAVIARDRKNKTVLKLVILSGAGAQAPAQSKNPEDASVAMQHQGVRTKMYR